MVRWFALAALPMLAFGQDQMPRCDLLPGWTQAGPFRTYVADTLYDYMNGNSEGYLIYGFQRMTGVTCKKGDASFVVDISEMPDAESAWGLYASNRDPRVPAESVGMGGQVVPQRGIFANGDRFVEISASPATMDHSEAIRAFLKAIEAKLGGSSAPPPELSWFPVEGLDSASLRLVPQSVLGLSVLRRGYLAKYDYGRAFITKSATPEAASQVMTKLQQRFGESQAVRVGDSAFQANDKYLGRLLFFRKGAYVGGFANLKEGFDATAAATALAGKIP
jgi:hypothetical protein